MSLIINTNIGSLNAQRSLATSSAETHIAMERLSSGSRINSASDDAAGFAISERMTAQIIGLNKAAKNVNDGLSILAVAENASGDVADLLQRMRELTVQAVSDTNSEKDRKYLQSELEALREEIERVTRQTRFNNKLLFGDENNNAITGLIQVGTEADQTVGYKIRTLATAVLGDKIGAANREITFNGDFDSGAVDDTSIPGWEIFNEQVRFNGVDSIAGHPTPTDTNFPLNVDTTQPPPYDNSVVTASFDSSISDETDSGVGNSLRLRSQYVEVPSYGILHGPYVVSTDSVQLLSGDSVQFDWRATGGDDAYDVMAYLVDVDTGHIELILNETGAGGGHGSAGSSNWATVNKDVGVDGSYKFVFVSGTWDATGGLLAGAQLYIDNVEFQAGNSEDSIAAIDLVSDASKALDTISTAIDQVSSYRADYGTLQNRLEYTLSNLLNVAEFTTSARSRIQDTDFARESATLAKSQILQQSATAMLAQANASSQLALSLIQ